MGILIWTVIILDAIAWRVFYRKRRELKTRIDGLSESLEFQRLLSRRTSRAVSELREDANYLQARVKELERLHPGKVAHMAITFREIVPVRTPETK